ncbi:hypothetical protein RintRC_6132 [Richelia intracellularis]|nr:hypothetical protein RintRC_6132 [Richelia intracellularis]
MARAIEHIEKEIAALEEAIAAIAQELKAAYDAYLSSLAQIMRQQLILASYHICTQGYPDKFLQLSLSQRQKLQQAIRQAAQQTADKLISLTNAEQMQLDELEQKDILMNYLRQLEVHNSNEQEEKVEPSEDTEEENKENEAQDHNNDEQLENTQDPNPVFNTALSLNFLSLKTYSPDTSNPVELLKWQQQTEARILANLKHVSSEVNVVLRDAYILPQKLPTPILDAAAIASEASAEMMPGPPNILNLVIGVENDNQSAEEPGLTQIMVVGLRLGEIEFSEPQLSSQRKQIRYVLGRLNKLGRQYQHKQREHSVAEAEAAWRASWYED